MNRDQYEGLMKMEKHHRESLLALILGGSLTRGFTKPDSDIDMAIVVESNDFKCREEENRLVYNNKELCTYENGQY